MKEADIDAYMWILVLANLNETGKSKAQTFSTVIVNSAIQTEEYIAGYAEDFELARSKTLVRGGETKYTYFYAQIKSEKKMSIVERLLKAAAKP